MERDILKKSRDHLLSTTPVMSRYVFIASCAEPWPVQLMCRVLAVSPAGFTSGSYGRPPRLRRGRRRRKRP